MFVVVVYFEEIKLPFAAGSSLGKDIPKQALVRDAVVVDALVNAPVCREAPRNKAEI